MYDLIIKNAVVVTMDKQHNIYSPGFVAVSGKNIADLGPMDKMPEGQAAKVIDAKGMVLMPGLVDAHGRLLHKTLKSTPKKIK